MQTATARQAVEVLKRRKTVDVPIPTGKPPKMSDVTCEAVNCKFNEGRKCHAKDIQVAGTNACTCMETECASFCCS